MPNSNVGANTTNDMGRVSKGGKTKKGSGVPQSSSPDLADKSCAAFPVPDSPKLSPSHDIYDIGDDDLEDFDPQSDLECSYGDDVSASDYDDAYGFEDDESDLIGLESDASDLEKSQTRHSVGGVVKSPTTEDCGHEVLSLEDLDKRRRKTVKSISECLSMPEDVCSYLLQANNWKEASFSKQFIDNPQKILEKASLNDDALKLLHTDLKVEVLPYIKSGKNTKFECPICYSSTDDAENPNGLKVASLGCGHKVCTSCFQNYLEDKINDKIVFPIKCPGDAKCKLGLTHSAVKQLVPADVFDKYLLHINEMYAEANRSHIKGCPAPDCPYYIELPPESLGDDKVSLTVNCRCNYSFCFRCGKGNHQPISCDMAKCWGVLSSGEDLSDLWVSKNTRQCPKCQVSIEKNDGCNHMSCRHCFWQFCWVCLGDWSEHNNNWNCVRMAATPQATSAAGIRSQMKKRFWHYSPRYSNNVLSQRYHRDSIIAFDEEQCTVGDGVSEESLLSIDAVKSGRGQFIQLAHKALYDARGTLAWTYVFLYYTVNSNQRYILEDNVINLEKVAEDLAQIVANPELDIPTSRFIELTNYVNQRNKTLNDFVTTSKWAFDKAALELTSL